MKLMHFSGEALELTDLRNDFHTLHTQEIGTKPWGFWVSDEAANYGWRKFCCESNVRVFNLKHQHIIELADDANILYLTSAEHLQAFTKEYGAPLYSGSDLDYIDWIEVAKKYQGIIITPYIWSMRLSMEAHWYYPWDCASGCIWDVAAIKTVTLVKTLKVHVPDPDRSAKIRRAQMRKAMENLAQLNRDLEKRLK